MKIQFCPNKDCKNNTEPTPLFYIKKGYYKTKHNHQPVPRYQCKGCNKKFSTHTFSETYKQKKPELNKQIFKLYASNMTQRRIAKVLGINKNTVPVKFMFLAEKARKIHNTKLSTGKINTSLVQFDEMETFEHTRMKPLSIALAVKAKDGTIIDARVATMNAKGHLAAKSREKYGWFTDTRHVACTQVAQSILKCSGGWDVKVISDSKRAYPNLLKIDKRITVEQVLSPKGKTRKGELNPMFWLNHICARIRLDLSRMGRKTWATTKKMDALQTHLDLYIAWHNKYDLF